MLGASRHEAPLAPEARPVDRASRPRYCVWEITLRCDLACRHCGSRAGHARPDELDTEECLDVIRQLAELGVREVSLIGGEVYLRPDWTTLIAAVRDHGMRCGVVTGGRGMTLERARAAKAAGISGVSVSLDGLEAAHDQLRALRGSFQAARSALHALRQADIPIAVNTQVNQLSRGDLEGLSELLFELGVYGWQVQLTVAMGRAADNPELLLQPYELLDVIPRLAALAEACHARGVRFEPGNNVGYFGPHEHALRRALPGQHTRGCTAGLATLGIEASGDVKGCPSLPSRDYVGGNLRSSTLQDIWERAGALRFTRDRTEAELWGFCKSCYYARECRAGCSWTSHVLFGRRGNNPYCHHRALELAASGRRERLVQTAKAPGEPFDQGHFELVEEALGLKHPDYVE
ncbi:MAG: radical SAM protein [Polyangiaceae bacterium]|nr:radical SAM protein [Polyangiaceae bacterium]MCW5791269.1 radical SAM protein [Polyangiaceae bacterium]